MRFKRKREIEQDPTRGQSYSKHDLDSDGLGSAHSGLAQLIGANPELLGEFLKQMLGDDIESVTSRRRHTLEQLMHSDEELRHQFGLRLAYYIHEQDVKSVFFLDSAARLGRAHFTAAWAELYPDETCPTCYFTNPMGYQTEADLRDTVTHTVSLGGSDIEIKVPRYANQYMKQHDDANDEFNATVHNTLMGFFVSNNGAVPNTVLIEQAIQDTINKFSDNLWPKYVQTFGMPRSRAAVMSEFQNTYQRIAADPSQKIVIVDTCSHTGSTIDPILKTFNSLNMPAPLFVTVSNERNYGVVQPDYYLFGEAPCYPFEPKKKTRLVGKSLHSVVVERNTEFFGRPTSRRDLMNELRQGLRFDVMSTSIWEKIRERQGQQVQMMVIDIDGTAYTRTADGVMNVGPNSETAAVMRKKGVLLVVNTSRPEWTSDDDTQFEMIYDLPQPDVVIANNGSAVYWRNTDGKLVHDLAHARKFYAQRMSAQKNNGEWFYEDWSPEGIATFLTRELSTTISDVAFSSIKDILVERSSEDNPGSIRMAIENLPYDELEKLVAQTKEAVRGLEIDLSELSVREQEHSFTGWLHITPGVNKGTGLKHVLLQLHREMRTHTLGTAMQVHAVGDSYNDLSMMQSDLSPDATIKINGYLVANASGKVKEHVHKDTPHVTILGHGSEGPSALNTIAKYLD